MTLVVLFASHNFAIAIAGYLPATLFLLFAFISVYERTGAGAIGWGIAGVFLSLCAAGVQRLGIGIRRVYLDHNGVYHVIQGAALWMIYKGARFAITTLASVGRIDVTTW